MAGDCGAVHVLHFPITAWGEKGSALCCVSVKGTQQSVRGCSGVLWRSSPLCGALHSLHNFFAVFPLCSCSWCQDSLLPMSLLIPLQKYHSLQARWSMAVGSTSGSPAFDARERQTSILTWRQDRVGTNTAWSFET